MINNIFGVNLCSYLINFNRCKLHERYFFWKIQITWLLTWIAINLLANCIVFLQQEWFDEQVCEPRRKLLTFEYLFFLYLVRFITNRSVTYRKHEYNERYVHSHTLLYMEIHGMSNPWRKSRNYNHGNSSNSRKFIKCAHFT